MLADSGPLLKPNDATLYRALAARLNYVALGRPDMQFATIGTHCTINIHTHKLADLCKCSTVAHKAHMGSTSQIMIKLPLPTHCTNHCMLQHGHSAAAANTPIAGAVEALMQPPPPIQGVQWA